MQECKADVQVWENLLARENERDVAQRDRRGKDVSNTRAGLTRRQADRFCHVGKSQPGKALKILTTPPLIPDCEALRTALPTKIPPVSGGRDLQKQITDEMRCEVQAALEKRAHGLKANSQPGFTRQKNEHIRIINKGPAGKEYKQLAVNFLEGRAPEKVYALYASPALMPRYEPATMS